MGPRLSGIEEAFASRLGWTPDRATRSWEADPFIRRHAGAVIPSPPPAREAGFDALGLRGAVGPVFAGFGNLVDPTQAPPPPPPYRLIPVDHDPFALGAAP